MSDVNDEKNFAAIQSLIKKGDTVVDVGANCGDYVAQFDKILKGTGKIYAIEMSPDNCDELYAKFTDNRNVIVMNVAVSDTNDMVDFYQGVNSYTHTIIGHDVNFSPLNNIGKVPSRRLDKILAGQTIRLIKIDVEGAELQVLRGMQNIRPEYVLLEAHFDQDWIQIMELMEHYKYVGLDTWDNRELTREKRSYQSLWTAIS